MIPTFLAQLAHRLSYPPLELFAIITALLFVVFLLIGAAIFSTIVNVLAHYWHLHRQSRHKPGHCASCGYDLRASRHRCPECGTPIPMIPCALYPLPKRLPHRPDPPPHLPPHRD